MTEQQQHLFELIQQRQQIISSIEDLSNKSNASRDLLLRVEGAIEYLEKVGVTLPEPEVTEEETLESQEENETAGEVSEEA